MIKEMLELGNVTIDTFYRTNRYINFEYKTIISTPEAIKLYSRNIYVNKNIFLKAEKRLTIRLIPFSIIF